MTIFYEIPGLDGEFIKNLYWDAKTQSFYFVNLYGNYVYRYDYDGQKLYKAKVGGKEDEIITFILPYQETPNEFVIGMGVSLCVIFWDGITPASCAYSHTLFNVDKSDLYMAAMEPNGNIYVGGRLQNRFGIDVAAAKLFSFETNGIKIQNEEEIINGVAWNTTRRKFYKCVGGEISVLSYDPESGATSFNTSRKSTCYLEHMVMHTKTGFLFAVTDDQSVVIYNPNHWETINGFHPPHFERAKKPWITSLSFGGVNNDELFIAIAYELANGVCTGKFFKLKMYVDNKLVAIA